MGEQRGRLIVMVGAVAAAVVVTLAGCTSPPHGRAGLVRAVDEQAVAAAGEAGFIAQSIGLESPGEGIAEYARRIQYHLDGTGVVSQQGSGWLQPSRDHADPLVLVGIEPHDDASWQEPVGALVLGTRLGVESSGGVAEDTYCVRLEFDRWGFVDGGRSAVDCPSPLVAVEPPPDSRPVIPEEAESIAIAVLAASVDAPADEIAAAIEAQLPVDPDGPDNAAVMVAREGDRVGVAMRDHRDCLLLRSEHGAAETLYVPEILLQPGELGCTAETALLPDESFRSPH